MGIRLVCEVLDHYHGPDARKLWLIAWAEKANDRTRAGWPTREVLAHRTGRSQARASNIATELCAEGVLKRDGGGHRGAPARFILLPLATEKGSESANPEDGVMGSESANPKPEVKGSVSGRKGSESARKGSASKPQPAETGSLPLTIPSAVQPSEPTGEPSGQPEPPVTAQTILAAFIDWVRGNGGDLTEQTIGRIGKQVGDLLRQGKAPRDIRQGLANWYLADQNVSTVDSFINSVINATARERLAQNGNGPSSRQSTTNDRAQQAREAGRRVQQMLDQQNRGTA